MSLDYLRHYRTLIRPEYAVLVTGAWGSGKTHQVREALGDAPTTPTTPYLYVSLYGEPSVESVHEAVLAASSPARTESIRTVRRGRDMADAVAGAGGVTGAIAGAGGKLLEPLMLRQLRRTLDESHLIVFDDLERSAIEPKALAGLINNYLEHHGCRVIALAAEEKLLPADVWRDAREKLFGQTLHVEPRVGAAFRAFFTENAARQPIAPEGPARVPSEAVRLRVEDVFRCSGIASLRIARQITHDVQRLLESISDTDHDNQDALLETVQQLAAWSGEVRDGRIAREQLGATASVAMDWEIPQEDLDEITDDADGPRPDIEVLRRTVRRYRERFGVDIRHGPLTPAVLEAMLLDGRYDPEAIRDSLRAHPAFTIASHLPPWRVLRERRRFSPAELEAASTRLEHLLFTGDAPDAGALTHALARLLWLAEAGLIARDVDAAVSFAREGIDAWIERAAGDAPEQDPPGRNLAMVLALEHERAHDGLAFLSPGHPAWDRLTSLRAELAARARDAIDASMPRYARTLLERMSHDPASFIETVTNSLHVGSANERFAFLHHLDVDAFLERCLALDPTWSFALLRALARANGRAEPPPERDVAWIAELARTLRERAETARGFEQHRLEELAATIAPPAP